MTRRRWIINASPVIFLAKVGALELLKQLADEVAIPASVHLEVAAGGRGLPDSPPIELPQWLILYDDLPLPPEIAGWDPLVEQLLLKGLYLSRDLVESTLREVGE